MSFKALSKLSLFVLLLLSTSCSSDDDNNTNTLLLTDSLSARYMLNEIVDNTCLDSSGNNLNATFQNGTAPNIISGIKGNAYSFSGTESNINVPSSAIENQSSYSIAFWINPVGASYAIAKGPQANFNLGLYINTGTETTSSLSLRFDGATIQNIDVYEEPISIPKEQWSHIALVCDNGINWKTYVNGILVDDSTVEEANVWDSSVLHLGGYGSSSFLNGALDDVYIYNRALSANDVNAIINE